MYKMCLQLIFLSILTDYALAGNRADVNADGSVNAQDVSTLANILAGNLDISQYDLQNVVVVAPQGGDFTDAADAADWVRAQSPHSANRYVILVTPHEYTMTRSISLPNFTALKGYGPEICKLYFTLNSGYMVSCDTENSCVIEGLNLVNVSNNNTGGTIGGVHVRDCTPTVFRDCKIEVTANNGNAHVVGVFVNRETLFTSALFFSTEITVKSFNQNTGTAECILLNDANCKVQDSILDVFNYKANESAVNVRGLGSLPIIRIRRSALWSYAETIGREYYIFGSQATDMAAYLGSCEITETATTDVPTKVLKNILLRPGYGPISLIAGPTQKYRIF